MNTLVHPLHDVRRTLDIDLVADFTCPWSWLGMTQLTRALGSLSGDVETRLRRLRPGQVVQLSGYLVDVRGPNGFTWNTSLRRDDTGDGACELMWIESVAVE